MRRTYVSSKFLLIVAAVVMILYIVLAVFSLSQESPQGIILDGEPIQIEPGPPPILIIEEPIVVEITEDKVTEEIEEGYSEEEHRLMSSIIFAEAGNQCYAGKLAVGIVVMNRVESEQFPNEISDVLYQKGQFTPAENGSLAKALGKYDSGDLPEECLWAAAAALEGEKRVYYDEQTIDLTDFVFFSRYVKNHKVKIQDHMFK